MSTVAQIIRQADTLKVTLSESGKSVSDLWVSRQRLEDLYKKLILSDLEYALDKKVEQDLWNHAFKNQINILQQQAKDKQNVKRGEHQASLNLFLETASGFYLQLLQQICTTFKLDLPFRRKSAAFGVMKEKCPLKSRCTNAKKSSCLYVCQHCLVHLGDIARYRQQVEQAQTYYRHAAYLVPQNGQPYNQLAILEVARGNRLSTVFYYIRSLAVRHPFPVAATNLEKFYIKLTRDVCSGDARGKLSLSEVVSTFLQLISAIHLASDVTKALSLRERLLSSMQSHVTSQSMTGTTLLQMVAVTIFTESHLQKNIDGGDGLDDLAYTSEEEQYLDIVHIFALRLLDLLLHATPKQELRAREFFTLPAIKVLLDWLHLNPKVLNKPQIAESTLWFGLVKLLNSIQLGMDNDSVPDVSKYEDVPLPEDCDLRCFQPIEKAHSSYSFSRLQVEDLPQPVMVQMRCDRIISHGRWLAQQVAGLNLLKFTVLKSGRFQFSAPMIPFKVSSGNERKTGRQNVAIQAIIQKKGVHDEGTVRPAFNKMQLLDDGTGTAVAHAPPKYLLGIPTSEPQFMKHGPVKSPNPLPSFQRFPSPTPQQMPLSVGCGIGKFVPHPRAPQPPIGPDSYGIPGMGGGSAVPHLQENMSRQMLHSPTPSQSQQIPGSTSPGQTQMTPPTGSPFRQMDSFMMPGCPRPPLPPSFPGSEGPSLPLSPAMQQQLRAMLMQGPVPGQPFQNMLPGQLLQVMKLANQMMTAQQQQQQQQQQQGMTNQSPPQQSASFSQAPGTERALTPPKPPGPHGVSARMPNFQPAFSGAPGYQGVASHMMNPAGLGGLPGLAQNVRENLQPSMRQPFGNFNPRTIQPPTQAVIDSRSSSTFQGHAEGTPKPENTNLDRRDNEDQTRKGVAQPRTYSLFSSSPWEVSPLAGSGEGHSIGSSPFSSASSSIRNSPDPETIQTPGKHVGGGGDMTHHAMPQYGGVSGLQSIWSMSGQSPLERLLEQQKQQRQGDPH